MDPRKSRCGLGLYINPSKLLLDNVRLGKGASAVDGVLASSSKTVLSGDALNTVGGVDVLNKGELPAGGTALAGSDSGGSKEVFPDLKEKEWLVRKKIDIRKTEDSVRVS